MKRKSNYSSSLLFLNILISIIILFFIFNESKKNNQLNKKLIKIEKKLDETLVPSTRIKNKKNKRKRNDWKN